jgi:hypothetical protein
MNNTKKIPLKSSLFPKNPEKSLLDIQGGWENA